MIFVTAYSCMTRTELENAYQTELTKYAHCKARGLNLNMAGESPRKPSWILSATF